MKDSLLDFAEDASSDWVSISKFEKAENLHYGSFVFSVLSSIFCWYFRSWFESTSAGLIPYNEYTYLLIPTVFLGLSIIGWRAKRNTNLSQNDLSLHYFGETVLAYEQNEYRKATNHLDDFETRATRSSNDLFTDTNKEKIEAYVNQFDDESNNRELFDESFEAFAEAVMNEVDTDSNFDELIDNSEENSIEKASTVEVIFEGLGGAFIDRYVLLQFTTVLAAFYVFYNHNQQLGMFLVVSLPSLIQYIKTTQQ